MTPGVYRFELEPSADLTEAELTFHLALVAAEGLFGEASVRMDAAYHVDEPRRTITVDATTEVGQAVVRVFTRYLTREFGDNSFLVRRVLAQGRSPEVNKCAC